MRVVVQTLIICYKILKPVVDKNKLRKANKNNTPHLDALPPEVRGNWRRLSRTKDALYVEKWKREWDAFFVVAPWGLNNMYGLRNLIGILQDVAGQEAPIWNDITEAMVVDMAGRMNRMRDERFVKRLQELSRAEFDEIVRMHYSEAGRRFTLGTARQEFLEEVGR